MRGAYSLSPELEKVVEALAPERLDAVVNEALAYVREEYADDQEILDVIGSFSLPVKPMPEMSSRCEQLSQHADDSYFNLEQAGRKEESAHQFCRMCTFNGLKWLFSETELTPRSVDEMIYDLGHGSASTDLFVERLIERLSQSE